MGKERERLIEFFRSPDSEVKYYGEENEEILKLLEFINHLQDFEEPDFFAKIGDEILLLEHFEFDSTNNNQTGSEYRKDLARINKSFDSVPLSTEVKIFHDEINCTHSSQNYIRNVTNVFVNHYGKIENYKARLIQKGVIDKHSNVRTCFFIDDVTCLGNAYSGKDKPVPLNLLRCNKFLDLFEKSKKLDYVFCGSQFGETKFIWFISKKSIEAYRENQIDIEKIEIWDAKPQISEFKFLVNEENLVNNNE